MPKIIKLDFFRRHFNPCIRYSIRGLPRPKISFYLGGKLVNVTKSRYSHRVFGYSPDGNQQGCLVLTGLPGANDAGDYTIVATNKFGTDNMTRTFHFIKPPGKIHLRHNVSYQKTSNQILKIHFY